MPALLRHTACPSCGRPHHFCTPFGDIVPGEEYRYVCPETGRRVSIRPETAGETVRHYPQGAVQLAAPAAAPGAA